MHFSFASETIFHIGSFPVTNTILNTIVVDAFLIIFALLIKNRLQKIPSILQNVVELAIEAFYNLTKSVSPRNAHIIFPYVMTFFLFILVANWSALIPGFTTIGIFDHGQLIPLLRGATSDINTTLALAVCSAVATHALSIKLTGIKDYISRYISFNPVNLFIGILEIISEITKVISLSFRLFGNIFAGEVVLSVVAGIFAFLFPLPFLLLEGVVGIVQALVFAFLTMAFMAILTTPHHKHEEKNKHTVQT